MKQDPRLQEALATLRPGTPPKDLTAKVRHRLQHPEPPPPPTLLHRLGFQVETRPVLVGLSGVAVCLLLVVAMMASRNVTPPAEAPSTVPPELAGEPNARRIGQAGPPVTAGTGQDAVQSSTDPILVSPLASDRVPMRARVPATAPETEPK